MADENKTLELQIRVAAQEAVKAVSALKGEIQNLASEAKKFSGTEGAALEKSFKDTEATAKESASSIGDIKKAIMSLAEVAAAAKALSVIKDLGSFALQTADNFQTMKNQFGVLLGDMEAGAGLFNEIKAFNDKTPFDMSTLTQATNVLIAAKVPLQDLQKQLTKFGDLSQGNSQRLTSYVNAFSQAAAKGKADMQVLNTYLHQGVPILEALAKNFNTTTDEIIEMSSQGKISFRDFSKALDDLTAAGGQYFGGMELASKSLTAMQEGLSEAVNTLSASFGELLLPAAIEVIGALTDMANAINESPLLKGLLAGALVAIAGYLGAMAVKASIAFAAQMSLNLAIGALNPVVLVATAAVAGLAASYTMAAADSQKAAREAENFALAQKKQNNAIIEATASLAGYKEIFDRYTNDQIRKDIRRLNDEIVTVTEGLKNPQELSLFGGWITVYTKEDLDRAKTMLSAAYKTLGERRDEFIKSHLGGSITAQIEETSRQLAAAREYLSDTNLDKTKEAELREIIQKLTADLEKLKKEARGGSNEIDNLAARWKESWTDFYQKWQADQSMDPFAGIELERMKKLSDAEKNLKNVSQKTIDEINAYYNAQRSEAIEKLGKEEERMLADLSKTRIDNFEYEYKEALKDINELETRRIIAAAASAEEIAEIQKTFNGARENLELNLEIEINKAKLDEARDAVKNWQEELSDNLLIGLMNLKIFSDEASVIISGLSAQLIELSSSAALSGFEEFGRALGEGKEAAESLQQAIADMAHQILKQLPMMFLQAGLQLIANGQWALGLGFIASAGSSAIISGYVDGAGKHAQGGVFDEYGQAARAFADGGAFTNQIVSRPTYFAHGGGLGLMGEAGPEAIMPLTRMPNGNLGVHTAGGGANVTVNIINNSNAEVRQEESTDAEGNKQIDVMIGQFVNNHITSGKADRAMSRFGVRPVGV